MATQDPACDDRAAIRGANPSRKMLSTRELLGNAREVVIEHGGEEYLLRITRNQKLILTK